VGQRLRARIDRGAQRRRGGRVDRDLDRVRARDRVGAGRHFAHLALQLAAARPAAHRDGRAGLDERGAVLGHREHHVARAVLRDAHDRRAGLHHLARLRLDGGDDTGHVGHQRRVVGLVALRGELRLRLFELGLRGLPGGFAALELGAADEVLLAQLGVALQVGGGKVTVGERGGLLGARGVGGELVVLRVELGQHLAGLHALAELGLAARDLARHAEAEPRLHARAHLGRELGLGIELARAHGHELDRANGLLGHGFRRTAGQEDGGKQQPGGAAGTRKGGGGGHETP
jgi:hypothetical protein